MVELIVGKKGKGKTKVLLDKVNGAVKEANEIGRASCRERV